MDHSIRSPSVLPSRSRKRRRRSPTVGAWATLLILLSLPGTVAKDEVPCLRIADETIINALLSDGGPGARIKLCPSQTYNLSSPIIFTAKDQEIFTDGYPEWDNEKATLMVVGGSRGVAVQGDCRRCARVTISHLKIDGNRLSLGRLQNPDFPDQPPFPSSPSLGVEVDDPTQERPPRPTAQDLELGTALVMLGNNEGQTVKHCVIRDPRGWTAIQVREGDKLSCSGAVIEDNTIGPAGEQWMESLDGESPELSPYGKPLADGLSIACRDSFVRRNTFIDTTDAALIIHCSPGSEVSHNQILSSTQPQMAGILMISSTPFSSDYSDLLVHSNTLEATSLMRVGIGIGTPVWSDDTETVLFGGTVQGNKLKGLGMGYGIAVSGVEDWRVVENESVARHAGKRGKRCRVEVDEGDDWWDKLTDKEKEEGVLKNPAPVAFLRNLETSEVGEYQEDFEEVSDWSYLVCIDAEDREEGDDSDIAQKPSKSDPEQEDEEKEQTAEPKPTESSVMNSILAHSQTRMLEAISELGKRVDALTSGKSSRSGSAALGTMDGEGAEILSSLAQLSKRVAALETERKLLAKSMNDFRGALKSLGTGMDRFETHETDLLSEILALIKSPTRRSPPPPPQAILKSLVATQGAWWTPFLYLFGIQGLMGLLVVLWRRWAVRGKAGKNR